MEKAQWIPIVCLRIIAMVAALVATVLMVTSRDSAKVLGMTFIAKYTNSPTLKYFVIVCIITTIYSLAALFVPPKKSLRHVLVLDMIVLSFLVSSFSAAVGVGQLGKQGNSHAGWLPICGQVPKFCHHVTASLIAGFVAVILYFLLLLCSLNNVLNLVAFKA
ncbi:CASP-like protein [Artemisia annua]|uniref:CASP-like protein n=1 Tax=Artemisia annua TaxID=35608 RepID=A0A2U1L5G4_ARTAN|nr:CASP-like protein [Artemisia annua]